MGQASKVSKQDAFIVLGTSDLPRRQLTVAERVRSEREPEVSGDLPSRSFRTRRSLRIHDSGAEHSRKRSATPSPADPERAGAGIRVCEGLDVRRLPTHGGRNLSTPDAV